MQYYIDAGRVSLPKTDALPTAVAGENGESTTSSSTYSLCTARLATSGRRDNETQGDSADTGMFD